MTRRGFLAVTATIALQPRPLRPSDDAPYLQSILDTRAAHLVIPPGEYRLYTPLNISNYTGHISGAGATLYWCGPAHKQFFIVNGPVHYMQISDFTFSYEYADYGSFYESLS